MAQRPVRSHHYSMLAALITLALASGASATGYWNMPSTTCQWLGCGFGGGYHAPMILGPVTYECFYGPNDVRLRYAPNPYACAPRPGGCAYGLYNQGIHEETRLSPLPDAEALPQPAIAPAARRPLFFPQPVQR